MSYCVHNQMFFDKWAAIEKSLSINNNHMQTFVYNLLYYYKIHRYKILINICNNKNKITVDMQLD